MENLKSLAGLNGPLILSDDEIEAAERMIAVLVRIHNECGEDMTIPIFCPPGVSLALASIVQTGLEVAR